MATVRSAIDIMGEFYHDNRTNEAWQPFFTAYDVGIPLAYLGWVGLATPTDDAVQYIDEAWQAFCEVFGVDHYNDFESLSDFTEFVDSPAPA